MWHFFGCLAPCKCMQNKKQTKIMKKTITEKQKTARRFTQILLEKVDNGEWGARDMLLACVKYMSEIEVEDMLRINEYLENEDEEII